MVAWFAAILANQAWRGVLTRAYWRRQPSVSDAPRWGAYWSVGATLAGALWGAAAVGMFPASPSYQALLIVCLFSVILGGLNNTVMYKGSFYGFVLAALLPLIARVAFEGDQAHLFTALVLGIVLIFVLVFGNRVNAMLTQSLAMRYENVDLIGELKAQTDAALTARAAAEAANRAKGQFLAAASHDLRQPLHAMGLFAAALAAKAQDREVKTLVASIHKSSEALEGLFTQLFDLSQLEMGSLTPTPMRVALEPLFARLEADFAPQARASRLKLRAARTRVAVDTDPVLLERILRNLLGNAVRYTKGGGVVLGARRRGAMIRIDVVDSGIGIAVNDHRRIFDDFVQLPATPAGRGTARGMGLGLAIVRRLADLLGHPIDLASRVGRGSRFSISVPRALPERGSDSIPDAIEAAPTAADPVLEGRCVIVIDDDPAVTAAMRALFASWRSVTAEGADAEAALTALAALGRAPNARVDLIIADLRLAEGASGIDAISRVRAALGGDIPALIISGDTSAEASAAVQHTGITLLAKPVVAAKLKAAVAASLRPRASDLISNATET